MKPRICVTTYVYGDRYQLYIPIAVWSIKKMYPEYDVMIFLHGKLNIELKEILIKLDLYEKIKILENVFSDCPNMSPYKAQALRWVLWDDSFTSYDYIYFIDIDMFYIKEPVPLHEQHEFHMKRTGLPFDNMRRIVVVREFSLKRQILRLAVLIKRHKIKYIVRYFINFRKDIYKLSGLHFVKVKEYYQVFTKNKILYYRNLIYDGSYVKFGENDEAYLYYIMKDLNFDVDRLAAQNFKNPYEHTDFRNYTKDLFRPTHGIHMGDYRDGYSMDRIKLILKTPAQQYYKNYIESVLLEDKEFVNFLNVLPKYINKYFQRYFQLSGIMTFK